MHGCSLTAMQSQIQPWRLHEDGSISETLTTLFLMSSTRLPRASMLQHVLSPAAGTGHEPTVGTLQNELQQREIADVTIVLPFHTAPPARVVAGIRIVKYRGHMSRSPVFDRCSGSDRNHVIGSRDQVGTCGLGALAGLPASTTQEAKLCVAAAAV